MSAATLLADLRAAGVTPWLDGDQLRCHARTGTMTDTARARLVKHKAELLDLLRLNLTGDDTSGVEHDPPEPCPHCDGFTFW